MHTFGTIPWRAPIASSLLSNRVLLVVNIIHAVCACVSDGYKGVMREKWDGLFGQTIKKQQQMNIRPPFIVRGRAHALYSPRRWVNWRVVYYAIQASFAIFGPLFLFVLVVFFGPEVPEDGSPPDEWDHYAALELPVCYCLAGSTVYCSVYTRTNRTTICST